MSWKNWSYTKKGGIIGIILGLLAFFGVIINNRGFGNTEIYGFTLIALIDLFVLALFLFISFFLGVFISWIIEKMKPMKGAKKK